MTKLIFVDVDDTLLSPPYVAVKRISKLLGKKFPTEAEFLNRSHIDFDKAFPGLFRNKNEMWLLVLGSLPFGYFASQKLLGFDRSKMQEVLSDNRVILLSKNPPSFTRWRVRRLSELFDVELGDRYIACGPIIGKSEKKSDIMVKVASDQNVPIQECVLIDDSPLNIREALTVGARGILIDASWNRKPDDRNFKDSDRVEIITTEEIPDKMKAVLGKIRKSTNCLYILPTLSPATVLKAASFFLKRKVMYSTPIPDLKRIVPLARSNFTSLFYTDPHLAIRTLISSYLTECGEHGEIAIVPLDGGSRCVSPDYLQPINNPTGSGGASVASVRESCRTFLEGKGYRFSSPALFNFEGHTKKSEVDSILSSSRLLDAISRHSASHGVSVDEASKLARRHADSIVTPRSYAGCLFTQVILSTMNSMLFKSVSDNYPPELRAHESDTFIIYASIHRSYLDSGVLYTVLANRSRSFPYIVAADKMRKVWIGKLGALTGAIFIERRFVDEIYTAVMSEFMARVHINGGALEVFLEGQRSRTGLTMPPKKGIASIVWDNLNRPGIRKVVIVPVAFAYNKIPESEVLLAETLADRIKNGSASLRIEADMFIRKSRTKSKFAKLRSLKRRLLSERVSECYVTFGVPVSFTRPEKIDQANSKETMQKILNEVMFRINRITTVLPSSALCLSVLSADEQHQRVSDADSFLKLSQGLIDLYPMGKEQNRLHLDDRSNIIESFRDLPFINRKFKRHRLDNEDLLSLADLDIERASYYSNNILHFYVLPALVATVLDEVKMGRVEELHRFLDHMFGKLAEKYFIPLANGSAEFIDSVIVLFSENGLIECRDRRFAVNSESDAYASLRLLSNIGKTLVDGDLQEIFEAFRRIVERIDVDFHIEINTLQRTSVCPATILNTSIGGYFLRTNERLREGDEIILSGVEDSSQARGKVVRVEPDGVGVSTVRLLKSQNASTPAADQGVIPNDRRLVSRMPVNKDVGMTVSRRLKETGKLRNISASGVLINCDFPVNVGDALQLIIHGRHSTITTLGLVSRLTPGGLGIKFVSDNKIEEAKIIIFLDQELRQQEEQIVLHTSA